MGSLTSIQKSVLIGSILGDGSIRKQDNRLNALLEINHSYQYKEYVDWKCTIFNEYVLTKPKLRLSNGSRLAYRFTTRSLPIFTKHYKMFYLNNHKIIPDNLILNPLSLAVWFMDDGSKSRNSYYLNTQQFSLNEQLILQKVLLNSFGIMSNVNKDKHYFRLRITNSSSIIMTSLVKQYILQIFNYKLINDPVTTELKNEILT